MKKRHKILGGIFALTSVLTLLQYNKSKKYLKANNIEKPTLEELNSSEKQNWKHEYIDANGINFHYVTEGEGDLVILLHGFPENWFTWREQIPALSKNHKVVALDMRGYNLTDRSNNIKDFKIKNLVEDIRTIIRALGEKEAHIVGHDWGGIVAWFFAMTYPNMVKKLAILNISHPATFAKSLKRSTQILRSWYMFFFQIPILPELFMSKNDFKDILLHLPKTATKPEQAFKIKDLASLESSYKQPGALSSMINYYRALRYPSDLKFQKINVPTMLLWGEKDTFLLKSSNKGVEKYVPNIDIKYLPTASHWVHKDEPELVNQALTEFFNNEN